MKARAILPGNPGHHAVQFYSDEERLCLAVADFLADGFAAGQPTLVIATPDHRKRIRAELVSRHFGVTSLIKSGSVMILDAQEMLEQFMVNGRPHTARFRAALGAVLERVSLFGGESIVRGYGEMVDVLCGAGKYDAAIQVEGLWNELAKAHSFSLLCGYSVVNVASDQVYADVCAHHTHVHGALAIA